MAPPAKHDHAGSAAGGANRPKNHLIVDATKPFTFSFLKFGREKKVTVDQTPEEATWRKFSYFMRALLFCSDE